MGLDLWLRWEGMSDADLETAGGIARLRSAYHQGGLETWAARMLEGRGYAHVFGRDQLTLGVIWRGPAGSELGFRPDWDACESRARAALEAARKAPPLRLFRLRPRAPGASLADDSEVLAAFQNVASREIKPTQDRAGEYFFAKPMKVLGAIWVAHGEVAAPMLVAEGDADENEPYVKAYEDALAFIALGREKNAAIAWSE